jgi:hypothetical protein
MAAPEPKAAVPEVPDGCHNCRHWLHREHMRVGPRYEGKGECHRYPPQAVGLRQSQFPFTAGKDCCAERQGV